MRSAHEKHDVWKRPKSFALGSAHEKSDVWPRPKTRSNFSHFTTRALIAVGWETSQLLAIKHLWPQYRPNRRRSYKQHGYVKVIQLASLAIAIWLYGIRYCKLVQSDVAETTATRVDRMIDGSVLTEEVLFLQSLTNSSPYIFANVIYCS